MRKPAREIVTRRLVALKPHPLNAALYGGEELDEALAESVRQCGILEPLTITRDDVILSGHRRLLAAAACDRITVPCIVVDGDPLDLEWRLIESNRQRAKSREQIGREARELLRIERERAKERQAQAGPQRGKGKKRSASGNVTGSAPGDARDRVGAALGVSGPTAERAAAVVDEIDRRKADGDQAGADQLRDTLNTQGVAPAHREVKGKPKPNRAGETAATAWPLPATDDLYDWSKGWAWETDPAASAAEEVRAWKEAATDKQLARRRDKLHRARIVIKLLIEALNT